MDATETAIRADIEAARARLVTATRTAYLAEEKVRETEGLPSRVAAYQAAQLEERRAQWDVSHAEYRLVRYLWTTTGKAPQPGTASAMQARHPGQRP